MANTFPIRIMIEGGSPMERERVVDVLRADPLTAIQALQFVGPEPMAGTSVFSQADGKNEHFEYDDKNAQRAIRESHRLVAIGRLAAEIAHEVNNPLESVGNLLYLALHENNMPARAIEYLISAERELERVVQISKQTLSFSRESANPVPVQLAGLMDEVVALYNRRIENKSLSLIREYTASEHIVALPGEIRQVFSNLVTNAIEASQEGGRLWLRIRDVRQHCAGRVKYGVRITVGDNGMGISDQARKRLGEMFFSTKGESGTGLGLWVTKGIVSRYGGTLQLRSSTGAKHGTVFSLFLPALFEALPELPDGLIDHNQAANNVTEISRHPRHTANDRANQRTGTQGPRLRQG